MESARQMDGKWSEVSLRSCCVIGNRRRSRGVFTLVAQNKCSGSVAGKWLGGGEKIGEVTTRPATGKERVQIHLFV